MTDDELWLAHSAVIADQDLNRTHAYNSLQSLLRIVEVVVVQTLKL